MKIYLLYNDQRIAKKKTHVKKRTLNPVFNESFVFELPHLEEGLKNISLEFALLDWDRVTKNEVKQIFNLHFNLNVMTTRVNYVQNYLIERMRLTSNLDTTFYEVKKSQIFMFQTIVVKSNGSFSVCLDRKFLKRLFILFSLNNEKNINDTQSAALRLDANIYMCHKECFDTFIFV